MRIYRDKNKEVEICSVEEWRVHCPPASPIIQWRPKRSAMEMAKFWTVADNQNGFLKFLRTTNPSLTFDYAIPEIATKFDNYRNSRKNDLCIFAKNESHNILISIEGKADEPFGKKLFADEWIESIITKTQKNNSKKLDRIIELFQRFNQEPEVLKLRYQLTYWFVGAIEEAMRNNISTVYLIVQEFHSNATKTSKITNNEQDLDRFIRFVSNSTYDHVDNNKIIGPINNQFTKQVNLFIGKIQKNVP